MPANCPAWVMPESAQNIHKVVDGLFAVQRFINRRAETYVLQHGDVKEWHRQLFKDVVPLAYYAGNYRGDDPRFPCLRENVNVGGLPGARFEEVPTLMRKFSEELRGQIRDLSEYLSNPRSPVDRARAVMMLAAYLAGSFVKIHPFLNGNGRISRMLINYVCRRYGYGALFSTPQTRPVGEYETASAACMQGHYDPMYRFLVKAMGSS